MKLWLEINYIQYNNTAHTIIFAYTRTYVLYVHFYYMYCTVFVSPGVGQRSSSLASASTRTAASSAHRNPSPSASLSSSLESFDSWFRTPPPHTHAPLLLLFSSLFAFHFTLYFFTVTCYLLSFFFFLSKFRIFSLRFFLIFSHSGGISRSITPSAAREAMGFLCLKKC
jgi:hypothetical protein